MLSASSVLMDVLENQGAYYPSMKEEQLSLNNAEIISLGDSSPRSTISSSLIEIEEMSEDQRHESNPSFHNDHSDQESEDEFSQFVLMEHSYDQESEEEEVEPIEEETKWKKQSPNKSHHVQIKEEFNTFNTSTSVSNVSNVQQQPKENSFHSSSRTSLLKGTTTTTSFNRSSNSSLNGSSIAFGSTASRFSLNTSMNNNGKTKPKSSNSFKRDFELENELLGKPSRPTTPKAIRPTSPILRKDESLYSPPPNTSSITLKDKKEIEQSVERLKVRQRYLEDRIKRESTPPRGRVVPPKPRASVTSERVVTKPLYEREPVLTVAQLQNSIEMEKRKKRIEEKRRELQESKNIRAKAIREEKQKRENYLKEDSFISRSVTELKRPSTPSISKRSTTPTNISKRPGSSLAERPRSSISIETVKPPLKNHQPSTNTSSRIAQKDLFDKHNSFLSDNTYTSSKDVKDFNALLREQEKLLNNIRELKNKIQPSSRKY